jgi:hypothetical protein
LELEHQLWDVDHPMAYFFMQDLLLDQLVQLVDPQHNLGLLVLLF